VGAFWELLRSGRNAITEVPPDRWEVNRFYDPLPVSPGKMNTRFGAFIPNIGFFDPEFFEISEKEARLMDPQQRLILELAWEALEDSCIAPDTLRGSRTGVFVGITDSEYNRILYRDMARLEHYSVLGTWSCFAANRVSYFLDLKGPSLAIDTACSSSLVAIHLACQSLALGESDLAIAGGVNLILSPENTVAMSQGRAMDPDGQCKTFDAAAGGYVRGEGGGLVVLKRHLDVNSRTERLRATIRGTAVNQDGRTNGITAPHGPSQVAVIQDALAKAGVRPADISYVEAHGTGTPLGDPIELKSLRTALMPDRSMKQPCWIGSVKTNIGHLEAAAGVAGLMKVVLALEHGLIPPHLNFHRLNPYISLAETPFQIPLRLLRWEENNSPRLASVSSFSAGGTNCHAILEEAPAHSVDVDDARPHILTIRAKTESALAELARRYVELLESGPDLPLGRLCAAVNAGRAQFRHRLAIVAESRAEFVDGLQSFLQATPNPRLWYGDVRRPAKTAFIFPGECTTSERTARSLYEGDAQFRRILDEADPSIRWHFGQSVPSMLTSTPAEEAHSSPEIRHFLTSYGLGKLWQSWGVKAQCFFGYGVGELAAACCADTISLEDAIFLLRERTNRTSRLPALESILVFSNASRVKELLNGSADQVGITMCYSRERTVVSGTREGLRDLHRDLQSSEISWTPVKPQLLFPTTLGASCHRSEELPKIRFVNQSGRWVSSLTGEVANCASETTGSWMHRLFGPVQISRAFETITERECDIFLELGTGSILQTHRLELPSTSTWITSLCGGGSEREQLLCALAQMSTRQMHIDWAAFSDGYDRVCKVALSTYPFERKHYWADGVSCSTVSSSSATSEISEGKPRLAASDNSATRLVRSTMGSAQDLRDMTEWLYAVKWSAKPLSTASPSRDGTQRLGQSSARGCDNQALLPFGPQPDTGLWLVFADEIGVAERLSEYLKETETRVALVFQGPHYSNPQPDRFEINPDDFADYQRLLDRTPEVTNVVFSWALNASVKGDTRRCWKHCEWLLLLTQAVLKRPFETTPSLVLVTAGAQLVRPEDGMLGFSQAPVWGLGRVITLEHPELNCIRVDLESASRNVVALAAQHLYEAVYSLDGEDEMAYRDGVRHVARLTRRSWSTVNLTPKTDASGAVGCPNSHPCTSAPRFSCPHEASYIVTGGLGALGMLAAGWLVARGAKNLVLIGRSVPNVSTQRQLDNLRERGITLWVRSVDVADRDQLATVFKEVSADLPPIRGIIHAAGVVKDAVLTQQTPELFSQTLAPKVRGAWNLHHLTQACPLDFFILYSSAASLFGSPGQANYCAANAYLDALACFRRAHGLPALSINWGGWSRLGAAADQRLAQRWNLQGIDTIAPEEGLLLLDYLVSETVPPQIGVIPIRWDLFAERWSRKSHPLLSEWINSLPRSRSLHQQPQATPISPHLANGVTRKECLNSYLESTVAAVLGVKAQQLDATECLTTLGLDSLMAMILRNRIKVDLGADISVARILQGVSILDLADLLREAQRVGFVTDPVATVPVDDPPVPELMESLSHLDLVDGKV
jgi:acyl transferase domain-containing protein/aryl carrier-like protein